MTIYAQVYPTNTLPEKSQIEQMYQVAYKVDPKIFQPEDASRFGLDMEKLKKYGAVEMSESLDRMRKHVHGLWARMGRAQKAMFLMSYVNSSIPYVQTILSDLAGVLGTEIPVIQQLNDIHQVVANQVALVIKPDLEKMIFSQS